MVKRRSGRPVNIELYREIMLLEDNTLYSPADITYGKFDKTNSKDNFDRMFHVIYQFGCRNGLTTDPDNCQRDEKGRPISVNGRIKLWPGHRRKKFLGKTWKDKLFDEDRTAILNNERFRLFVCLQGVKQFKAICPSRRDPDKKRHHWPVLASVAALLVLGMTMFIFNSKSQIQNRVLAEQKITYSEFIDRQVLEKVTKVPVRSHSEALGWRKSLSFYGPKGHLVSLNHPPSP